ncbi:MAG: hypothetical protein V4632_09795 [Pseudomonadota bacterium]
MNNRIFPVVMAVIAACVTPMLANAQQAPADAPPSMLERLEEGEVPPITIYSPNEREEFTEYRLPGGKVIRTRVRIGNDVYYLYPNDQYGSALPGDVESNPNRSAQWNVLEFEMGGSREARREAAARAAASTPPPPPLPSASR